MYLVAMGWVYVTKFRDYQDEIDKYLRLIPLISLVDNTRVRPTLPSLDTKPCLSTAPKALCGSRIL